MTNIASDGSKFNGQPRKQLGDVLGERVNGKAIAVPHPAASRADAFRKAIGEPRPAATPQAAPPRPAAPPIATPPAEPTRSAEPAPVKENRPSTAEVNDRPLEGINRMSNIVPIRSYGNGKPDAPGLSFTIVWSRGDRLTKAYKLEKNGKLASEPAPPLSSGIATRIDLKGEPSAMAAALAGHLQALGSDKAIIPAPPPAGRDSWPLVKKAEIGDREDVVARSPDYFRAPAGPALFALDLDLKDYPQSIRDKLREAGGLSAVLASVFPGFADAACVTRPSASNGIENGVTGETTANNGQHRYYFIRDGLDAEGFARRLADRLTLAGFSFGHVSKTGLVLHKTLIDVAASSDSSRLFYEANAKLGAGLSHVKDARKPIVKAGGFVDTHALPPLDEEESARLAEIRAAIERDLAPACKKQRERYKAQREAALIKKGVSPEAARKAVFGAVERHILSGDFEIVLDRGPAVTARDILADPARFHKKTCADPLEPEYGGGRNLAVIYTDHPPFHIYSQAHGGIDYWLLPSFDPVSDEESAQQAQDAEMRALFDPAPEVGSPSKRRQKFALEPFGSITTALNEEWLVKRLLPRQGVVAFYGASQSFKSFIVSDLALHVALGREWAGRRVTQAAAVYIAAEGAAGIRKRKIGFERSHADLPANVPFYLISAAPNLGTERDDVAELTRAIEDAGCAPGLVVIDTLAQTLGGGDENGSGMTTFLANATAIANRFRCLVLIVHHIGLADDKRMRGHSSAVGAMDAQILVERRPGEMSTTLTLQKLKDEASNVMLAAHLSRVVIGRDEDGDDVSTLIVDRIEDTEAAPKASAPKSVPASQRLFMDVVAQALDEAGEPFELSSEGRIIVAVNDETVREKYYARIAEKPRPDDTPKRLADRQRQAFNAAVKANLNAKRIVAGSRKGERLLWLP